MTLEEVRDWAALYRMVEYECDEKKSAIVILDDRITELEAERDGLAKELCETKIGKAE